MPQHPARGPDRMYTSPLQQSAMVGSIVVKPHGTPEITQKISVHTMVYWFYQYNCPLNFTRSLINNNNKIKGILNRRVAFCQQLLIAGK
jgi:hypothetical protein